jgi:CheY-like chemotaxis protein
MKDPRPADPPILFADDDENDTLFFRLAFETASIPNQLIAFANGQEVIDYLSNPRHPLPSLLVLDLKMPRVDGFDVLGWLQSRSKTPRFPVVVLSASQQELDINRALALGAADYKVKPIDYQHLVALVAELGDRWLAKTRPQPVGRQ